MAAFANPCGAFLRSHPCDRQSMGIDRRLIHIARANHRLLASIYGVLSAVHARQSAAPWAGRVFSWFFLPTYAHSLSDFKCVCALFFKGLTIYYCKSITFIEIDPCNHLPSQKKRLHFDMGQCSKREIRPHNTGRRGGTGCLERRKAICILKN